MSKPAFNTLDAIAVPLDRRNVDTDQIIPARFLRKPRSAGMADYLFHDLRADPDGVKRSDFILHHERYQSAQILVARDNFGSGSSREAAVYALWDFGFRAVVAPSFGDIFFSNSLKNGLLPIVLDSESVEVLLGLLLAQPGCRVKIDLASQALTAPAAFARRFEIDAFQKQLLLTGQDELGYTLALGDKVDAFERQRVKEQPWMQV